MNIDNFHTKDDYIYNLASPLTHKVTISQFFNDLEIYMKHFRIQSLATDTFNQTGGALDVNDFNLINNYFFRPLTYLGSKAVDRNRRIHEPRYLVDAIFIKDDEFFIRIYDRLALTSQDIKLTSLVKLMHKFISNRYLTRTIEYCVAH